MGTYLKNFQKDAVKRLIQSSVELFSSDINNKMIVFQAPTGSGKTIITAEYIKQMVELNSDLNATFIWASIGRGDLQIQSKNKLTSHFDGYPIVSLLENINQNILLPNSIVVVNFEKLYLKDGEKWVSHLMREGDHLNFRDVLENTRRDGIKIILIIDESHLAGNEDDKHTNISKLRNDVIRPDLSIEVSATPSEESIKGGENKRFVTISSDKVVDEELIKKKILINTLIEDNAVASNEYVLEQAYRHRILLAKQYEELGSIVNPLVLVQIPDGNEGKDKRNIVERFLAAKDVTIDNGKLAVWLSSGKDDEESKRPPVGIEDINNPVQFLIFKQAIATGWDCPRAQILVKFRDASKNHAFDIQTAGRILRMPEAKYYHSNDELNYGYIYTNMEKIEISSDEESKNRLAEIVETKKRDGLVDNDFMLPAEAFDWYRRSGLNTIKFRTVLMDIISNRWKEINLSDEHTLDIAIVSGEIDTKKLADNEEITTVETKNTKMGISQIEDKFNKLMRSVAGSFESPVEASGRIKDALIAILTERGIGNGDIIELEKYVLRNEEDYYFALDNAVEIYKSDWQKIQKTIKPYEFRFGISYSYNKNTHDDKHKCDNYLLANCYFLRDRYKPERWFEGILSKLSGKVKWWWKNGGNESIDDCGEKKYFSMHYDCNGEMHLFYPDYLVGFDDGRIGIFEVKDVNDDSPETTAKAKRLREYLDAHRDLNLVGGIVVIDIGNGLYIPHINRNKEYHSFEKNKNEWEGFRAVINNSSK